MQTRRPCKEKSVWILMKILDNGIQLGLRFVDGALICFTLAGVLTLCGLDLHTSLWGSVLVILSLIVINTSPDGGLLGMFYQQGKQRRGLS